MIGLASQRKNSATLMEMKPKRFSLGRNPLSDAPHRNPGVVENEQGSSHLTRRVQRVRKLAEPRRIRLGSWNVGSLTGKLRELVDAAVRRGVDILCVQETKWRGQKAKEVEDTGFKLWYTGTAANRNGVGILINKSLKYGVVDVKRRGDRIILVKLVVGTCSQCYQRICPASRPQ